MCSFVLYLLWTFELGAVEVFVLTLALAFVEVCVIMTPQWDAADAEIKVPSVDHPELAVILPLKPGVGKKVAAHAFSTARNLFLVQIFNFLVHLP